MKKKKRHKGFERRTINYQLNATLQAINLKLKETNSTNEANLVKRLLLVHINVHHILAN
jgi:hypothetical protein